MVHIEHQSRPDPYTWCMGREEFEHHLASTDRQGEFPERGSVGSAGSSLCGDEVEIALKVVDGEVVAARYRTSGCGATKAAASVCTESVEGATILEAATVSPDAISIELGGLSPPKMHAAELVADALHKALSSQLMTGSRISQNGKGERVLVAMSGGVDSAVAAQLKKRSGADVVAVTLKLWHDPDADGSRSCCSPQAVLDARGLAHSMGIPHFTLDLQSSFRDTVVGNYLKEHDAGRTPNPCVRCNGTVRFEAMLELAEKLGAARLVTGHYAKVECDGDGPLVAAAEDLGKDQSYMLSAIVPDLFERVEFPLASLTKTQARELAREENLPVAEKEESQDLCFLAGIDRESFLDRHGGMSDRPGEIVDRSGRKLGEHLGHHRYTVGQRRGLGLAAQEPQYVLSTDAKSNKVVVGPLQELELSKVEIERVELYRDGARVDRVKFRYRQDPQPCSLEGEPGRGSHPRLSVRLDDPIYGASPGQVACLMEGRRVIGWGVISG